MADPSTFQAFLEFLKTPNRAHFVLWIGCGALLFLPDFSLTALGMLEAREATRPFLGFFFFLLSVLFVVVGVQWGWKKLGEARAAKKANENRVPATPEARSITQRFLLDGEEQVLDGFRGAVQELYRAGIIYAPRAFTPMVRDRNPLGDGAWTLPKTFLLTPAARKLLYERPELIGLVRDEGGGFDYLDEDAGESDHAHLRSVPA